MNRRSFLCVCLLFLLSTAAAYAQLSNDMFSSLNPLVGFPATTSGNNSNATLEVGEMLPFGWESNASKSVWFSWTAEADGDVQIDTIGSTFDTMVAVWVGDSVTNLSLIEENDSFWYNPYSVVLFTASSGTTYLVSLYGGYGESGDYSLSITNDQWARISGTVTSTNGNPLPGISVDLYHGIYMYYTDLSTETDALGNYTLRGLLDDTYRVMFNDWSTLTYASQTYSNSPNLAGGLNIVLDPAEYATGIDATLLPGSSITGTITNRLGEPIADVSVELFQTNELGQWMQVLSVQTDTNGNYFFGGLSADQYKIAFSDYNSRYISEVYDDVEDINDATILTLGVGETLSSINADLLRGSIVSGTVTGPGSIPLTNFPVTAMANSGFGWYELYPSFLTDSNGLYQITGLYTGIYRIKFGSGAEAYVVEFYDDATNVDLAVDIIATDESVATNINAELALGGGISGRVSSADDSSLENIYVGLFKDDGMGGWSFEKDQSTDAGGNYAFIGLAPGAYRVGFTDIYGSGYISEYFDNAADLYVDATSIIVPPATMVTNINAVLEKQGSIGGTVRGPNGKWRLGGITVELFSTNDFMSSIQFAYTDEEGSYLFSGLAPGDYRVRVRDDYLGIYSNQVYAGAQDIALGSDITVTNGGVVTNIDFTLSAFASISGVVTGPDGTNVLEGILVTPYYQNPFNLVYYTIGQDVTDSNGMYTVYVATNNIHLVSFVDTNEIYLPEIYSNSPALYNGTQIFIPGVTNITGINESLSLAARISGTVTADGGVVPLEGIEVYAYAENPLVSNAYDFVRAEWTGTNGSYSIPGLSPGHHRIGFAATNGFYAPEFFDNAINLSSGTNIFLTNGAHVVGIDASLAAACTITGRVTATDGVTGVSFAYVRVLRDVGYPEVVKAVNTDVNGYYQFAGIAPGTYRIDVYGAGYLYEVYSNKNIWAAGDDIVLAAGDSRRIDFQLSAEAQISGVVNNFDGSSPLYGIAVSLYRANSTGGWDYIDFTYSDGAGFYIFFGLPPGTYRVEFSDPSSIYATQAYSNGVSILDGTSVIATEGSTNANINAAMGQYGSIRGFVYDAGLSPTGGVRVNAYQPAGSGTYVFARSADSGFDGSFNLAQLRPGTYRVFIESNAVYEAQSYSNKSSLALGDDVTVGDGEVVTNIQFILVNASTNAPDPDSDGDGVPDAWEILHFGSTSGNSTNMAANGQNTLREAYIADLDPNNPTSVFPKVVVTNPPPGTMSMVVNPTSTARVYQVLWITNLISSPQQWTVYPPEKTGTGSAVSFIITNEVPGRIYRTGVRLPESQ